MIPMPEKEREGGFMNKEYKIGVFLCKCDRRIESPVHLETLERLVQEDPLVSYTEVIPFSCTAPGLARLREVIKEKGLNRIVVAGCEARILLGKIEKEMMKEGFFEGQVDMVNLRDHVAAVNTLSPEEMAAKGAKLIRAATAGLASLELTPQEKISFNGPVMMLGGGIATYAAAQELLRREIDCIIAVQTEEYEDEIRMLHEHYPGERHYYDRLRKIMEEVHESPFVRRITVGDLSGLKGRTGQYTVTFSNPENGGPPRAYEVGAIIACLDGQMLNQGSNFGHDGKTVICHTETEELIWVKGVPSGKIIFWINDYESGTPEFAYLSSRCAWSMARYMAEHRADVDITMFYNHQMAVPLSAEERRVSRQLKIKWVPFDGALRPTVQAGYLTYCDPKDHMEYELPWDKLILSPRRSLGVEATRVARVLGLDCEEGQFLEVKQEKVRPEQVGREPMYLAGSARFPCDLHEALRQGRRAADQTAEIVEKDKRGELYAPRMVCVVDPSLCIGCGLCKEICHCGGITPVEGLGGGIPRTVDPMVCTGGGTCAAACPYHALILQNNTTLQRESRVAALAQLLADDEVMAFGCNWGGLAAADNAGVKGLKYDPRLYLLRVGCIGQLDPAVMARAFVEGANGLILIGCPPEDCHHSFGLDHTWSRVNMIKKLLAFSGFDRRRIALAHVDLNQPEEYIASVESFIRQINALGPIEKTDRNREKLAGLYATVNNARVRWVLGATLRRPWEEKYPGDQRNALSFDKDFLGILKEEFTKSRLKNLFSAEKRYFELKELVDTLQENKETTVHGLQEMVSEGMVSRVHRNGVAQYIMRT
jgi:heterodisulfide reductase subunit A-like polyferredoxin/coenzyme F420-reducing hydrogenase delta subunit